MTDASGRVADFRNCVIVMTSNLGARDYQKGSPGFLSNHADFRTLDMASHFSEAVRKFLKPEIYNRLDAILPFHPLSQQVIYAIAQRQVELLRQRQGFRSRPLEMRISKTVIEYLAQKGHDVRYGARPLKRTIERDLLNPLAQALSSHSDNQPLLVDANVFGDKIKISVTDITNVSDYADKTAAFSENQRSNSVIGLRRSISRLKHSSVASELENQVTMFESVERRLEAAKWKSPERQARIQKLPRMRVCLSALETLNTRSQQIEMEYFLNLYQNRPIEPQLFDHEINDCTNERKRLMTELFRLTVESPDNILIAIYSEHQDLLLKLAMTYYELMSDNGKMIAFDWFLPSAAGRSIKNKVARKTVEKLDQPFLDTPEKCFGVVMHFEGDLFYPRLQMETGQHWIIKKGVEQSCLVEVKRPPFDQYEPPAGIERKGAIKSKGASLCRCFNQDENSVQDAVLGERPWKTLGFKECMSGLIEERLQITIERATQE